MRGGPRGPAGVDLGQLSGVSVASRWASAWAISRCSSSVLLHFGGGRSAPASRRPRPAGGGCGPGQPTPPWRPSVCTVSRRLPRDGAPGRRRGRAGGGSDRGPRRCWTGAGSEAEGARHRVRVAALQSLDAPAAAVGVVAPRGGISPRCGAASRWCRTPASLAFRDDPQQPAQQPDIVTQGFSGIGLRAAAAGIHRAGIRRTGGWNRGDRARHAPCACRPGRRFSSWDGPATKTREQQHQKAKALRFYAAILTGNAGRCVKVRLIPS